MRRAPRHPQPVFSAREAEALVAALRIAQGSLAPHLAASAESALTKLLSARPGSAASAAGAPPLDAASIDETSPAWLEPLKLASEQRRKTRLAYRDLGEQSTEHKVRPLGCYCWGNVWMLTAWCESHEEFHTFRIDHVDELDTLEEGFVDEPGRTLADMFRQVEAEMAERDSAIDA